MIEIIDAKDNKPADIVFSKYLIKWNENKRFTTYKTNNEFIIYDKKNNEAIGEVNHSPFKVKNLNLNKIEPEKSVLTAANGPIFVFQSKLDNKYYVAGNYKENNRKEGYVLQGNEIIYRDRPEHLKEYKPFENKIFCSIYSDPLGYMDKNSKNHLNKNDRIILSTYQAKNVANVSYTVFNKETGEIKSVNGYKFKGISNDKKSLLLKPARAEKIPTYAVIDGFDYGIGFGFGINGHMLKKFVTSYFTKNLRLPTELVDQDEQKAIKFISKYKSLFDVRSITKFYPCFSKVYKTLLEC